MEEKTSKYSSIPNTPNTKKRLELVSEEEGAEELVNQSEQAETDPNQRPRRLSTSFVAQTQKDPFKSLNTPQGNNFSSEGPRRGPERGENGPKQSGNGPLKSGDFWSETVLGFMWKVLRSGSRQKYTKEMLYDIEQGFLYSEEENQKLRKIVENDREISFSSLWWFASKYTIPNFGFDCLYNVFNSLSPLLLEKFIGFLEEDNMVNSDAQNLPAVRRSVWGGLGPLILLTIALVLRAWCSAHAYVNETKIKVFINNVLGSLIVEKLSRFPPSAQRYLDFGKISYIVSGDVDKVSLFIPTINSFCTCFIFVFYYIYLLYRILDWPAFLFPTIIMIGTILQKVFLTKYYKLDKKRRKLADERSLLINEVILGIETIKFNAWELLMERKNTKIRRKETDSITWMIFFQQSAYLLIKIMMNFSGLVCFALYHLYVKRLTVATVFASLALFSMIDRPFDKVITATSYYYSASTSANRIYALLDVEDYLENYDRLGTQAGDKGFDELSDGDSDGDDGPGDHARDDKAKKKRRKKKEGFIDFEDDIFSESPFGSMRIKRGEIMIVDGHFSYENHNYLKSLEPLFGMDQDHHQDDSEGDDDDRDAEEMFRGEFRDPESSIVLDMPSLSHRNRYQVAGSEMRDKSPGLPRRGGKGAKRRREELKNEKLKSMGKQIKLNLGNDSSRGGGGQLTNRSKTNKEYSLISSYKPHRGEMEADEVILKRINLQVKPGQSVGIAGDLGSGKTALLLSILNELTLVKGRIDIKGKIAYIPEVPFMINSTIRKNITFGRKYEKWFYAKIIKLCLLEQDFEFLPKGDLTMVEERGAGLSISFKHRVSMARAFYSRGDIYLVDNCFSGIHPARIESIFNKAFLGFLKNKTVVMVTCEDWILEKLDKIFLLENGHIEFEGKMAQALKLSKLHNSLVNPMNYIQTDQLVNSNRQSMYRMGSIGTPGGSFGDLRVNLGTILARPRSSLIGSRPLLYRGASLDVGSAMNVDPRTDTPLLVFRDIEARVSGGATIQSEGAGKLDEDENIEAQHFLLLIALGGRTIFLVFIGGMVLQVSCHYVIEWWAAKWGDSSFLISTPKFILIYVALIVLYTLFCLQKLIGLSFFFKQLGFSMFKTIFWNLLRSPLSFFNLISPGIIINRCTNDVEVMDYLFSKQAKNTLYNIMVIVVTCVFACLTNYILIVVLFVSFVLLFLLLRMYLRTSIELGKLFQASKAPILSKLYELIEGSSSVRVYGYRRELMDGLQDDYNVVYSLYLHYDYSQFFTQLVSEVLMVLLSLLVGLYVLYSKFTATPTNTFDVAMMSLIISKFNVLCEQAVNLINSISDFSASLVCIRRLIQYYKLEDFEADLIKNNQEVAENWPKEPKIRINHLSFRYGPHQPFILKNINLNIKPGEKIAIIGDNGSGRSTLILSLLRLIEINSNKQTAYDKNETNSLPKKSKTPRYRGSDSGVIEEKSTPLSRFVQKSMIFIDGVDIKDLGLHFLRTNVVAIPQASALFEGTIRSNIDPTNQYSNLKILKTLKKFKFFENLHEHHIASPMAVDPLKRGFFRDPVLSQKVSKNKKQQGLRAGSDDGDEDFDLKSYRDGHQELYLRKKRKKRVKTSRVLGAGLRSPRKSKIDSSMISYTIDDLDRSKALNATLGKINEVEMTNLQTLRHRVETNGANLSLGQRQLICLARAILQKPKILLMDEATSCLDQQTDIALHAALRTNFPKTTIITMANRLISVIQYDRLVLMREGKVVEKGTPLELIRKKGELYKLLENEGPIFVKKMRFIASHKDLNFSNAADLKMIEQNLVEKGGKGLPDLELKKEDSWAVMDGDMFAIRMSGDAKKGGDGSDVKVSGFKGG